MFLVYYEWNIPVGRVMIIAIKNYSKIILASIVAIFVLLIDDNQRKDPNSYICRLVTSIDDDYHEFMMNNFMTLMKYNYRQLNKDFDKKIYNRKYADFFYRDLVFLGFIKYPNEYGEEIFIEYVPYIYTGFMLSKTGQYKIIQKFDKNILKNIFIHGYIKNQIEEFDELLTFKEI